jgi:hypothetical protein
MGRAVQQLEKILLYLVVIAVELVMASLQYRLILMLYPFRTGMNVIF